MTNRQFALVGGLGLFGAVALLIAGAALESPSLQAVALVPLAAAAAARVAWTFGARDLLLAAGLVVVVTVVAFTVALIVG